ncbi:hypothetical protein PROFUN_07555 [Planoprotostelium fungivorum]|uniref:Uncharacterized protein n=1 Tax=Planoprotostelium fungivorum TaxID=1890364 RepID=A0A2P6NLR3_9EUKA|nr:hypothetical protein PROFUN_07555 [Planoprotostelium fungivorum]
MSAFQAGEPETKEAIPGFEPGFQGSEPRVLTATLYGLGVCRN